MLTTDTCRKVNGLCYTSSKRMNLVEGHRLISFCWRGLTHNSRRWKNYRSFHVSPWVLAIYTNHSVGNLVHKHKTTVHELNLTLWESCLLQCISRSAEKTKKIRKFASPQITVHVFWSSPKRMAQIICFSNQNFLIPLSTQTRSTSPAPFKKWCCSRVFHRQVPWVFSVVSSTSPLNYIIFISELRIKLC